MKKVNSLLALVVAVTLSLFVGSEARGQNYSIDWFTIDGGGGTSSGGAYSLSGTIGQSDAGRLSGDSFALDGGFWGGVFAAPTVGVPTLNIQSAGSSYTISW